MATEEDAERLYETQLAAAVIAARARGGGSAINYLMGLYQSPAHALRGFINLAENTLGFLAEQEETDVEEMAQRAANLAACTREDLLHPPAQPDAEE